MTLEANKRMVLGEEGRRQKLNRLERRPGLKKSMHHGFLNILDILVWFTTIILIITSLFIVKVLQHNPTYTLTSSKDTLLSTTQSMISLTSILPLTNGESYTLATQIMLAARRPPRVIGEITSTPGSIILTSNTEAFEAQHIHDGRSDLIIALRLEDCARVVDLTSKLFLPASIRRLLIPEHGFLLIKNLAFCTPSSAEKSEKRVTKKEKG